MSNPAPRIWHEAIDAWCRWLAAAGYRPATIALRRTRLRNLAATYPDVGPWQLGPVQLAAWASHPDAMGRARLELNTRRSYRATLVAFYRWALEAGHTATDPSRNLPRLPVALPRPHPVREADYRAVLALAPSPREALMLRLGAELGLRRAEVAQVHRRDLVLHEDGWWLLVHGKGGAERELPCTPDLAEAICDAGDGWTFPAPRGGHLAPGTVGQIVAGLLPAGYSMHALRHRFATQAYALERDLFAVQELLGHARADTTRHYVATTTATMRHTVRAMEAAR